MLLNAIKENIALTFPILSTRLLSVMSNLIAMILIAKLGTEALSASALIMGIFGVCMLFVMSFSFSVCGLVAEANACQNPAKVGSIIYSSLLLNTILAIPFLAFFYYAATILIWFKHPPDVAHLAELYFRGMLVGYLPMIWAGVLEQFFIGIGQPRYMMYLSIGSLLIMPLLCEIFIFGKFGFTAMGMFGAGFAVSAMSILTLFFLFAIIAAKRLHQKYVLLDCEKKWDAALIKKLYSLGWPIALQFSSEFLAYSFMTLMMGWLGVIALAAQQIILQFTTIIVMIPTSVSQATAVLVGKTNGCGDKKLVRYHVNIALGIVSILMGLVAFIYLLIPETLINIYLEIDKAQNRPVLTLTTTLLVITALSQFFDGVRNVLAGAYRGLQETKIPMIIGTMTLWFISIPLAYYLGFGLHHGAIGVRWGFIIGIACGASILAMRWYANINLFRIFTSRSLRGAASSYKNS